MCEPTTIAIGAMAVGTTVSAYGQYSADMASQEALEYQADSTRQLSDARARVFEWEAKESDYRAKDAAERGRYTVNRYRTYVQREISARRAQIGGAGIELTSGSAQQVLGDIAREGAMDAVILEHNFALEAWGYKQKARKFRESARLTRMQGGMQAGLFERQAEAIGKAAPFKAGGTLLSGFGKTYMMAAG